jgi:hypothetical protein
MGKILKVVHGGHWKLKIYEGEEETLTAQS